jgi:plasmid stability protein
MARLYVRNVPDERYEALRRSARENHRSIAAEVITMVEEALLTANELEARRNAAKKTTKITTTGG